MAEMDAVARLRFISDGAKEVEAAIGRIRDRGEDLDKTWDKLERGMRDTSKEAKALAESMQGAGKSADSAGDGAKSGAEGWDRYSKALKEAGEANKKFRQNAVIDTPGSGNIPAVAASEMSSAQRQNLIAASEASNPNVVADARRIENEIAQVRNQKAEEARRVADVSARQWIENEERKERESRRVADAVARQWIESEEKRQRAAAETARLRSSEMGSANYANTNTLIGDDFYNRVGLRASETTFAKEAAAEAEKFANSTSPRLRYALYDIATTAGVASAAITAVGAASIVAGANFESAFTNVERTLDDLPSGRVAELREELIGLTRDLPKSFDDIAGIATLGNQLGINPDDITKFTEVVTKFSTATGLSADAAAQAFGSLGQLLNVTAEDYEKLGSAIALVGRRSVATEPEIVAMTTRLAASATNAGFTADQVVALSGAFASLRIAPERAQGVMEVYFNRLNTAIANGGEQLEAFGTYAGLAADDVASLVKEDPTEYFRRLSTGLGKLDQVAQTRALQELGLDGIRAGEVFGRVSANIGVFTKALNDSQMAWTAGTELQRQYALTLDDIASKWQIFINGVMEASAAVGTALAPAIGVALDLFTNFLNGITTFIETPLGQGIAIVVSGLAAIAAALAGIVATAALAGGSFLAIKLALVEMGVLAAGSTISFRALMGALFGIGAGASAAAVGLRVLRVALISTGVGAVIVLLGSLIGLLVDFGGTIMSLQGPVDFIIDMFTGLAQSVVAAMRIVSSAIASIPGAGAFSDFAGGLQTAHDEIGNFRRDAHKEFGNFVRDVSSTSEASAEAGRAIGDYSDIALTLDPALQQAAAANDDLANSMGGAGDAANDAAQEIRTLVDYANDLSGVFSRAFEIRYGGQQALDSITSAWSKMRDEAQTARLEMARYRAEISELNADTNIKKYQLRVAELYKDEKRAAKLRAEIASNNAKVNDTQKKLNETQADASTELEGNSDAAIKNRAKLLELVGGYQSYITALASSGLSQDALKRKVEDARRQFVAQATQLGYSRQEVNRYAASFDDLLTIIRKVPRSLTVDLNTNPALQALNEYEARLKKMGNKKYSGGTISGPKNVAGDYSLLLRQQKALEADISKLRSMGEREGANALARTLAVVNAQIRAARGYQSGGYTGNGGTSEIAGVVHGKEFVMSAPAVRNAGGPNAMAAMHTMLKSGRGLPVGQASMSGMVELSAFDRQLLLDIRNNIGVTIGAGALAGAVNGTNSNAAHRRVG